ncbi:hypothetical protein [Deinococcus aerophilus]|uniref:Cell division protein FtsL n=1 Tax=Deinococcus aerophilus TaxID=522488 RepID=A0ABQ2GL77_9DEIO|nr:hypothetical protein [Deinococcus aerophilus]GGM01887.1 hypothetical protein GCM10010841_07890 [Deinococcus aerophilus]
MTASRSPWRAPTLDLSVTTWRNRAIRYVLIYLALALALVVTRALTQHIRPDLRTAEARQAALTTQRDDLTVQLQGLENPQRIRDWALANGMRRFAEVPKTTQEIQPLPPALPTSLTPPASAPGTTVEVKTQWK